MLVISRSVHIHAPVEQVFSLMADPTARARLNPATTNVEVEIEGGQGLRQGSVCHFRLRAGDRLLDYRTRVREFERNRRIVSVSDSTVPFEVHIETTAEDGGTRVTQTERFEPTEAMLHETLPKQSADFIRRWIQPLFLLFDTDSVQRLRQQEEQMLRQRLETDMERWLAAIKGHLETRSAAAGTARRSAGRSA